MIGYLSGGWESTDERSDLGPALRRGLGEQGYVPGRNVEILYRWAEDRYERLPDLAADLVRSRVNLIVATGGAATALTAKSATAAIPVVFTTGADPVELGLVASLSRPGANVTGVTFLTHELLAKRLELLHEMVPRATLIGFLVNPTGPQAEAEKREAEAAARVLGVRLLIANASTQGEIEQAVGMLEAQQIGALMNGNDALFDRNGDEIAALAARYAVPAIFTNRDHVKGGGLMSYAARFPEAWRLAGTYAGRILKGEKPARPAGTAIHTDRDGAQSQDREGARHRGADGNAARAPPK